jgi:hypothetical protein
MFEITEGDVLLAHLNTRTEKHGDEDIGAIDLKIKCRAANTILDLFDPRLRSTLFQRAGGGQQADMHSPEHLPQRVFPHIPSVNWDDKLDGYTAVIGTGLGLISVTLGQVKVHKFKFEPVDGGTVDLTYTVSCNPSAEQVAAVYPLNGQGIILTLTPPKSDGAGASKIKDEAIRQKQAEEGQPDILDEQERAEKERADAIADAWQGQPSTMGEFALLPPPVAGEPDAPETETLVTLLAERGYDMTAEDIENPAVIDDPAYALLLSYLRGDSEAPPELEDFRVPPSTEDAPKVIGDIEEVETETVTLDKPAKKPRKGKTVD